MERIDLGHPGDPCSVSFLAPGDPFRDGYDFVDFMVEVRGEGLTAASYVRSAEGKAGFAAFIASLATDWKGWDGTRHWEAIEHDLHVEARHDGWGHVTLRFALRESYRPTAWEATVQVVLEAGEELTRFADDVRAFLRTPFLAG